MLIWRIFMKKKKPVWKQGWESSVDLFHESKKICNEKSWYIWSVWT